MSEATSRNRLGYHHSEETKRRMSLAHRGKPKSEAHKAKLRELRLGKKMSEEQKRKIGIALTGRQFSLESRAKLSTTKKAQWENPAFREKQIAAMYAGIAVKPTKPEVALRLLLDRCYPGEWKYTGDFQTWIDGKCPDFININGRKAVLELFGDYWHSEQITGEPEEQHVANRIAHFARNGFECLVIWEREVGDEQTIRQRIDGRKEMVYEKSIAG